MKEIKDIKVSLIVAIYNSELFLEKLINSIIHQTHNNLEIILVDDGSPDRCGEICDKFASKDSRITVIHKLNGGCCDARNKGLEKVTGDYLAIIDGDDWLAPDFVEYLLKLAVNTGSDMSMSLNLFTTRDQIQIDHDLQEVWTIEDACVTLMYPKITIGPWNKLYKTSVIKGNNIDFSIPWSGEGYYFAIMAAQYSNQIAVGRRKIYNYRLNNTGSGLTNYKVVMGVNALWNTENVKNKLIVRTPRILNAVDYHIWSCYYFILFLITATNSRDQDKELYSKCLSNLRKGYWPTIINSEVSFKHRIWMTLITLFPIQMAKLKIRKAIKALSKDKMK